MAKAKIDCPATVVEVGPGDDADLRIYPGVSLIFIKAVDYLFPQLVSAGETRNISGGFSGFTRDGRFIGCVFGRTLASIRKNPWLKDEADWFMRFTIACYFQNCIMYSVSITKLINYGTLRYWQKLGMGAERSQDGKVRAATKTPESEATMQELLEASRLTYVEMRQGVKEKRLCYLDPVRVLPQETCFGIPRYYNVSLDTL